MQVFLGRLRESEMERLHERISSAVMETCLAMTIFREDFNVETVAMFVMLTFVKVHSPCAAMCLTTQDRPPPGLQSPLLVTTPEYGATLCSNHCAALLMSAYLTYLLILIVPCPSAGVPLAGAGPGGLHRDHTSCLQVAACTDSCLHGPPAGEPLRALSTPG